LKISSLLIFVKIKQSQFKACPFGKAKGRLWAQLKGPICFLLSRMETYIKKRNRQFQQAIYVENPRFYYPYCHYEEHFKEKGHNSNKICKS